MDQIAHLHEQIISFLRWGLKWEILTWKKIMNDPVSVVPKGQNLNSETLSSASDKHNWLLVHDGFPMWDLPLGTGGARSWSLVLSQLGLGTGCLPWSFHHVNNVTGFSEGSEDQMWCISNWKLRSVNACVSIFEILKCFKIFKPIFFHHHHLTDVSNLIFLTAWRYILSPLNY